MKKLQKILQNPLLIKKKENLLYLTGRSFMHGYLLIKPKGTDKRGVVFFGDGLEKPPGLPADRLKNLPLYLTKARLLNLEDQFTFAEYNYIKAKRDELKARFKISHVRSPVDYQRIIKESGEIALVKKSMQIVERVFKLVRREIKKTGMTEIRLAKFIQDQGSRLGAQDVSFPAIVASGANAAIPHHVPGDKKLKAGESIILDFGFKYKNYCSDFTRTVFLRTAPKKIAESYNQVEQAYLQSINFAQAGAKAGGVYQKSVDVLAEKKLDKYFIHSLGHGTGLEIHELPNLSPLSKDILQNGMVFSVEPGVYIPKLGGVRIEDLVYLQQGRAVKFINVSTSLEQNIIK
ncbi:MAG: M24 family metallopeptidase [Patescibacteria group bacterium]|nr:M24 family metallopeptidase [Patescibacteria group bacterium]